MGAKEESLLAREPVEPGRLGGARGPCGERWLSRTDGLDARRGVAAPSHDESDQKRGQGRRFEQSARRGPCPGDETARRERLWPRYRARLACCASRRAKLPLQAVTAAAGAEEEVEEERKRERDRPMPPRVAATSR